MSSILQYAPVTKLRGNTLRNAQNFVCPECFGRTQRVYVRLADGYGKYQWMAVGWKCLSCSCVVWEAR